MDDCGEQSLGSPVQADLLHLQETHTPRASLRVASYPKGQHNLLRKESS